MFLRFWWKEQEKLLDKQQTVFIIDDDEGIRDGLSLLLESVAQPYRVYNSAIDFLESYDNSMRGCIVLDIRMPQMSGLELQEKLNDRKSTIPVIFITGHGDIPMAVEAMRQGAIDFIRKPFREQELLDRIHETLEFDADKQKRELNKQDFVDKIASLSKREREVFHRVADGQMNKVIGYDLGISERTVEVHRSNVMKKLEVRTLAQLIRVKIRLE